MNTIWSNRMSVQISNRLHLQITHHVISQQLTVAVGNDLPPLTPAAHLVDLPSDLDLVRFHHFLYGFPDITQPHVNPRLLDACIKHESIK